jgi:hypothetical protein
MDPDWTARVNAHAAALNAFKARPHDECARKALRDAMYAWVSKADVDDAFQRLTGPYWLELYNAHVVTPLLLRKTKKQLD